MLKLYLFLSLSSLFCSCPSFATSFYIRPFSEFTQSTETIVHGTLSNIHTENGLTPDGAKTIYTFANCDVQEVLKGNITQNKIIIRKIGGSKDGLTLQIPSSPEFTEGEETVLFLSGEREDHSYEVTGLELGKFGLRSENGESILTGGIFNYAGHDSHPGENHATEAAESLKENTEPWSINRLKALIQKQRNHPVSSTSSPAPAVDKPSPPNPEAVPSQNTSPSIEKPKVNQSENETHDQAQASPSLLLIISVLFIFLGAVFFYFRKR